MTNQAKLDQRIATAEGSYQAERYRRERVEEKLDRRDAHIAELEARVKAIAAAAWREGFVAAHNMERGKGLAGMGEPVDRFLWNDIDAWCPYSGDGTTDPLDVEDRE